LIRFLPPCAPYRLFITRSTHTVDRKRAGIAAGKQKDAVRDLLPHAGEGRQFPERGLIAHARKRRQVVPAATLPAVASK
jgi:hypothetical protein